MIPFALLTRSQKNTKHTNLSKIELPQDSMVVQNARQRIEEEKLIRSQIKEQTLQ